MTIIDQLRKKHTEHQGISSSQSLTCFDEATQGAYTHGLESIYSLENVDPDSIRPLSLGLRTEVTADAVENNDLLPSEPRELQLYLDIPPEYRHWLRPVLYEEPLEVLQLSNHAEQCLRMRDFHTIGQLLDIDLTTLGLGQGHYDEIASQLSDFTKGRPKYSTTLWDWGAFLRVLCYRGDVREVYPLLQRYGLEGLLFLPRSVRAELKGWHRKGGVDRALEQLRFGTPAEYFREQMAEVVGVLVKRWLRGRNEMASTLELRERLELCSRDVGEFTSVWDLLSFVYSPSGALLAQALTQVSDDLYCVDAEAARRYHAVQRAAVDYFRPESCTYAVEHLVSLLLRDPRSVWCGWSEAFVENVLVMSPLFRLWKDDYGRRVVGLH